MKEQIITLLKQGVPYSEIVRITGCAKATISYHAGKIGTKNEKPFYDWNLIQSYHDKGYSATECSRHFGFNLASWHKAVVRGAIIPHSRLIPLENLLVNNRPLTARTHLKGRLIKAGILTESCSECGLTEWRGKPLALQLHHINGKNKDNRRENLTLLCPNCHTQTDSYGGKNLTRKC